MFYSNFCVQGRLNGLVYRDENNIVPVRWLNVINYFIVVLIKGGGRSERSEYKSILI